MLSASHRSVVAGPIRNPAPRRSSAEIYGMPITKLPELPDDLASFYKRLFTVAFSATSQSGVCANAAKKLDASPDKIWRIMEGFTDKADFRVILAAMLQYEIKTGSPIEIAPGLAARFFTVQQ